MLLFNRSLFPVGFLALLGWWFAYPVQNWKEKNALFFAPTDTLPRNKSVADLPKQIDSLPQKLVMPLDTPNYRPFRLYQYQSPSRYQDYFSLGAGQPTFRFNQFQETIEHQRGFGSDSLGHYYKISDTYKGTFYRNPFVYSQRDFQEQQTDYNLRQNWRELAGGKKAETALTGKDLRIKIPAEKPWFERIFGGEEVEFTPVGFVNLDFGIQNQRTKNPTLPIRQQRLTTFNFDPHANISISGKVGTKLKVSGSFDTKASFGFENAFKVDYQGSEEDIIRDIDFGNVTFNLPTTLIQGGQNLFGISTDLQFGRLRVRSVFSQQRSRAETISLRGGAQRRSFSISCGDYEDNRHFFLSQFFRNNYEFWLSAMPQVVSGMNITRLEVYVVNRVNNTQALRNAVAFLDLGEARPYKSILNTNTPDRAPRNNANKIPDLTQGISLNADQITSELTGAGFTNGEDFLVMRSSRKLEAREYTFQPQLGYISLLTPLRNDEALAVAYEYTLNGKVYRVGELTDDYTARPQEEVVKLKMLRPNSIRLDLPTWDLMMKNIYSLNATSINKQNFLLRIVYRDDLTGIDNPTLQEGVRLRDKPLLRVANLDRLNSQNDPQPDGNFDFIDNITMDARNGRVIFPVLEPFGSNLVGTSTFATDTRQIRFDPNAESNLISKYVFTQLYRSTKADALQAADKNKFFLVGSYEGAVGQQVSLPGLNIPQGSVKVTMGGIPLQEGTQYTVDYTTGQVEILDPALKDKQIDISFEKADLFSFQQRRLFGTRLDYEAFKEKDRELMLGATYLSLSERPVITRVNLLEEPVNNRMLGFDISYKSKSRFLTRLVDALPFINTKAESDITFAGEYAQLFPRASKFSKDVSLIDDFEGTRTAFNFSRNPQIGWKLGATPLLFPEATSTDLNYAYRRAKLAWYNVDNLFYRGDARTPPVDLDNHYVRAIQIQEVYPNRQRQQVQLNEPIFDFVYYPEERGQYNYNPDLTSNGLLKNPRNNFAGITRAITSDIDFDNANVEYLEFWLMDPFLKGTNGRVLDGRLNTNNTTGADLYINLGNISEDVIPDGKHGFENGLPTDGDVNKTTATEWGRVTNQQYLNNAFPNEADARPRQDVGLDGLNNEDEVRFDKFANFRNAINTAVTNPDARQAILSDISADNFDYFLGDAKDAIGMEILERYKRFNGMDGNTPFTTSVGENTPSSSNFPDNEDMNADNTITNVEGYYQYKIPLRPNQLKVGNGYIISQTTNTINGDEVSWYLFRIPIRTFQEKVGNIDGFKSIRYLRMFVTNAEQPIALRFSQYQIVANQWRRFLGDLSDRRFGLPLEPYDAKFAVSTVNIEENGDVVAGVTPYKVPLDVIRDRDVTSPIERQLNEQSMQLCVTDLRDRDARAVFRNYNLDFLSYEKLQMYVHAQSENIANDDVTLFIRLGTDFTDNYYEIELPLKLTPKGTTDENDIWREENKVDIEFDELVNTKVLRNKSGQSVIIPFSRFFDKYRLTVAGNPDLSATMTAMIGIRNPDQKEWGRQDDKLPKSVCVWVNELRTKGFKNQAGWAALARTSIRLADFAQVNGAMSITTFGFGTINQRISERARATTLTFDASATVALDKFFPDKWGLRLPMFVGYEERRVLPFFNPLDPDVELKTSLENIADRERQREYEALTIEKTTRRNINFTNVKKVKMNPNAKPRFWNIENFGFTWAHSEEKRTDIRTADYLNLLTRYGVSYSFTRPEDNLKPFEPFAKSKAKWIGKSYMQWLKDFNFNFFPNSFGVTADLERSFIRTLYRGADLTTQGVEPLYQKRMLFNRNYNLVWNFTKSISLTYNALANAVVDEPDGNIDTQEKRDSILTNLRRFGRMKMYNQGLNLTYKVPFDKLPIINWVTADVGYSTKYTWTAGAIGVGGQLGQADTLGNLMGNDRNRTLNGAFDLAKLYKKSKLLTWAQTPKKEKPKEKDKPKTGKPDKAKDEKKELKKDSLPTGKPEKVREWIVVKTALRTLLLIKRVSVNYTLGEQTTLPGYLKTPRFFGLDSAFTAPGADFALLGSQNPNIKERAAAGDWIARSTFQNNPFTQSKSENLKISVNIEPLPDFKITVDAQRTRQGNYTELFRFAPDTLPTGEIRNVLKTQNPLRTGSYSVSFLGITTAFSKDGDAVFNRFVEYRKTMLARLTAQNSNVIAGVQEYDENNADVLIASFIAAYGGRDKEKSGLGSFPKIPLPNWQFDYSGLSKLPALKDKISSFSIRHSYQSTYTVGSYSNSLVYGTDYIDIRQSELDYQTPNTPNDEGKFVPVYVVNQVSIQEKFSPLLGVTMRTKKNLNLTLDYSQDRDVSLNLANAQVSELRNKSIRFSFGYIKAGMRLPFKNKGKNIVLKNDVDMRLDFTLRDSQGFQRKIDEDKVRTSGNKNIQVRPTINYVVNKQLSVQFYLDRQFNDPRISTSYKRIVTSGGVQVRYNVAP